MITLLCANDVAPFHIFSTLPFCVRARCMQIIYTQTHPSLFSLLDHAISFNSPTKFAGKSRRARRGEAASTRHGASRSCRTVHKRIVRIYIVRISYVFSVIYSRLRVRLHFIEIFCSLSRWNWQRKKTTIRTTDAVRLSDARVWN